MEKNTKEYNDLKTKLEKTLDELNCNYTYIELDDNDVNYAITIDVSKAIKFLNNVSFLIFADTENNSLTLIAINIYSFKDNEDLSPYYKTINEINSCLTHGKFTINEDIREIVFTSSINCSENFNDLTVDKIKLLTSFYFNGLKNLLMLFRKRENNAAKKN